VAEDNDENSGLEIRTEDIPGMTADLMKSVLIRYIYFSVSRCKWAAVGITASLCLAKPLQLRQWFILNTGKT